MVKSCETAQFSVCAHAAAVCSPAVVCVTLVVSLAAVPQHAVRSSELHHGESGEHPAVQPLAPAHPDLTLGDRIRIRPGTRSRPPSDKNSWTETQNAALDWTGAPVCQDERVQTKLRRRETKRQNDGIQNWFWLYLICFHFGGFQSFKAVLLLYKKRWSIAIIEKKWKYKKIQ